MAYLWKEADGKILSELNERYDAVLRETEKFDQTPKGVRVFYVSSLSGSDENDGKTPKTAFASPSKLEGLLQAGDTVLFACGSVYRESVPTVDGVTYSSFGEGAKPRFYGSFDASDEFSWIPVGNNVYRYSEIVDYYQDIGNVTFDDGRAWGIKLQKRLDAEAFKELYNVTNGVNFYPEIKSYPMKDGADLSDEYDLTYFHDFNGKLYLVCKGGNPAKRFSSVELGRSVKIFNKENLRDVTITNLHFSNVGCFAIRSANCTNLTVKNCKFEFIGGSVQFGYKDPNRNYLTRYGNAIENWGWCDGQHVENCFFKQIYDAAITTQYNGDGDMKNLYYRGNVFDCVEYSYELWAGHDTDRFINVAVEGCVCKNVGDGMSTQRTDRGPESFFNSNGNHEAVNGFVRNNLVMESVGSLTRTNNARTKENPQGFIFEGNTYLLSEKKQFGLLPAEFPKRQGRLVFYPYHEETVQLITSNGMDTDGTFYYTK